MDENLECQICHKDVSVGSLSLHIQKHLKYRPMQCKTCAHVAFDDASLNEHLEKHGHEAGEAQKEEYMEYLVEVIRLQMEYAGEYGLQNLLKRKPKHDYVSVVSAGGDSSSTARSTPAETKESRKRTRERGASPPAPSPLNSRTLPSLPQLLAEALTSDGYKVRCALCKKRVDHGHMERRRHCIKHHLGGDSETDHDALVSAMKRAFHGMTYSDNQCIKCMKEVQLASRRNHVTLHYEETLKCPFADCPFSHSNPDKLNEHLRGFPHYLEKGRSSLPPDLRGLFERDREAFICKLKLSIKDFFPAVPLVLSTGSPRVTVAEKPKTAVPPVAQTPVAEDSSSDDEEEEVTPKKKKKETPSAKASKTRKDSSSEIDEEEEEEESESRESEKTRVAAVLKPVKKEPAAVPSTTSLSTATANLSIRSVKQEIPAPRKVVQAEMPVSQTNPPAHFIARVVPPARTARTFPTMDAGRLDGVQRKEGDTPRRGN